MSEAADNVSLAIDAERCIGSGMCEMLEEAVFELDDDTNIATLIGAAALPRDRALVVIDRCPSSAIVALESNSSGAEEE